MSDNDQQQWIVTSSPGLEPMLEKEIAQLGGQIVESGGHQAVICEGALDLGYKLCLHSRLASRVLLPLYQFSVNDADELYKQACGVDWTGLFSVEQSFALSVTVAKKCEMNGLFALQRLKDAIVDTFRARENSRPTVSKNRPDIALHLYLDGENAFIRLDFSGESLHRRGYRIRAGEAPIKETLAAAMAYCAVNQSNGNIPAIVDPMCGSGTVLIETAWLVANIAPGLGREYFGFLGWKGHQPEIWHSLCRQAKSTQDMRALPKLIGWDCDPEMIKLAADNVRRAGLQGYIHLERSELAQLKRQRNKLPDTGVIITNPPFGERLGDKLSTKYLYRFLGLQIAKYFSGWNLTMMAGDNELVQSVGLACAYRMKAPSGKLATEIACFDSDLISKKSANVLRAAKTDEVDAAMASFGNRVLKNQQRLKKWLKTENPMCYRIYDADIPEFNVAVDVYGGYLHVQEYAPPKTVDEDKAAKRMQGILHTLRQIYGIHREQLFVKTRSRQKGSKQYRKREEKPAYQVVEENGASFLVNLNQYLDTGLFLDHRPVRQQIQSESPGKRFLNLFCYSGSATVHAALGGAKSSVSVDLSPVYLSWAEANLALNGFSSLKHQFVQSDVMTWLEKTNEQFDLIFLDPPTFSNSKRSHRDFDIQKQHEDMIELVMKRLDIGGKLIFSNNYRKFQLSPSIEQQYKVVDISKESIPPDFARNNKIHRCWEICRL